MNKIRRCSTACVAALGIARGGAYAADEGKVLPDVVVTGTREGTSINMRVLAGVRYDHLTYRFRNRLSGAPIFVAPGTPFPGPRFYGQASDADPSFTHVSPKLGATYAVTPETHAFVNYSNGFRAPSEGNLFRPAVGSTAAAANLAEQSAPSLKPIKADQIEAALRCSRRRGLRGSRGRARLHKLEWVRLGRYWLDPANTQTNAGHDVLNVRSPWPLTKGLAVFASVYNIADKRYADSAQLSNNQPVLSPGLPRTFYGGLEMKW